MSIFFSDNFDGGVLTGWGSPNDLGVSTGWGSNGSDCVGCTSQSTSSRRTNSTPIPDQGAIRLRVACILTDIDPTDGSLVCGAQDFANALLGSDNAYQVLYYLLPTGAFRIRRTMGAFTTEFENTIAGRFPTDGTQFGLQLRFTIGATNNVTFTVNDIDVATISWTHTYVANQWDDLFLYGRYTTSDFGVIQSLHNFDDLELDDDPSAVTYLGGIAPKLDIFSSCSGPPPAPLDGGVVVLIPNPAISTILPVYDGPCDIISPVYWTALQRPSDGKVIVSAKNRPLLDKGIYFGGPKDATIQSLGAITRAASDWLSGSWQAQTGSIVFTDTDHSFRNLFGGDNPSLANGEAWIYVIDEFQRRTQSAVPRLLFRGLIYDDPLTEYLSYTVNLNDIISAGYNLFKEDKPLPVRRITSILFPNAPDSIVNNSTHYGAPIIYGTVTSDVGALNLINVGAMTFNGVDYPVVGMLCGHAVKEVTAAFQNGDLLTEWGGEIFAPGHTGWPTIVPSGALYNDIGGQRFTLFPMTGTIATNFIAGQPVAVNCKGIETNGDGTGTLITRLLQIYKHLLVNWIAGSYNSGVWLRPQQFSFFPGQGVVDSVDEASFDTADTLSELYLAGGFQGRVVIGQDGQRQSIRQTLSDANICCNVSLGLDEYSRLFVRMLDRRRANFIGGKKPVDWKRDMMKTPPRVTARKREWLATQLVIAWNYNYGTKNWDGGDTLRNDAATARVNDEIVAGRSYTMIGDDATAHAVGQQQLDFMSTIPQVYTWAESLCGLRNEVLDGVPVTDYNGSGPQGFIKRGMWIIKQTVDPKSNTVTTDAIDVDYLLDPVPVVVAPAVPAGSLAFTGFGDAPMKFLSPDGVDVGQPVTAPVNCGAGCEGIVTVKPSGRPTIMGGNEPNFPTTGIGIFETNFAVHAEGVSGVGSGNFAGNCIARDDSGGFYGTKTYASLPRIYRYDESGALTHEWNDVTPTAALGVCLIQAIGVNGAGTKGYYTVLDSGAVSPAFDTVYAWDLSGDTALGTFATEGGGYDVGFNGILALSNGEVLIGWKLSGSVGYVKHYSATGTLLFTYVLPGTNPSPTVLTPGFTDATVWVSYYNDDVPTSSGVTVVEIQLGSGIILHSFAPTNGSFEFDGPFCALQIDAGAPPSRHPPDPPITGPGSTGGTGGTGTGPSGGLTMVTTSLPAATEGVPYGG